MPYDPQWPQNGQNIDADRFRDQFSGVIDLINAAPGITGVVVDGVTTLPAGDPATVSASVVGTVLHLSFGLPQGNDGAQGATGNNGNDGPQGPQGPPFANAIVDAVNTLNPGEPATVGVIFDGTNVRLTFGIPRGSDGAMGLPGEVSQVDLNNAQLNTLSQTSNNSNAVATLDMPFADPDAEALRQAYNALVAALRR
jgi:hypothetical protein